MPGVLIFVLVAIGMITAIVLGARQARKRREAMAAMAASLGLRFEPSRDASIDDRYHFLGRLKKGSNRYAFNRMTGEYQGHAVDVFDYHYETYSHSKRGRRTHHHHFSFFLLQVSDRFPELTIAPEHVFAKIGQFLGFDDIDFESAEFSDAFSVKSKDKKFAYDICHPRMMEFLLANRDLSIEIDAHCLSLFFGRRLAPPQIPGNLDRLVSLRELIPDYVLQSP